MVTTSVLDCGQLPTGDYFTNGKLGAIRSSEARRNQRRVDTQRYRLAKALRPRQVQFLARRVGSFGVLLVRCLLGLAASSKSGLNLALGLH